MAFEDIFNNVDERPEDRELKVVEAPDLGPKRIVRNGDVYSIFNLTLYGLDGKPYRQYARIDLDAEAVKGANGGARIMTHEQAVVHYRAQEKSLISLPELYAIMEASYDLRDEAGAQELVKSLQVDFKQYLNLSTEFQYDEDLVYHNVDEESPIVFDAYIPGVNRKLEDLVGQPEWGEQRLRAIFMAQDVAKIPEVLKFYGRDSWFWTPSLIRDLKRTVFAGLCGYFFIGCDCICSYYGRLRGVRKYGAGGAAR